MSVELQMKLVIMLFALSGFTAGTLTNSKMYLVQMNFNSSIPQALNSGKSQNSFLSSNPAIPINQPETRNQDSGKLNKIIEIYKQNLSCNPAKNVEIVSVKSNSMNGYTKHLLKESSNNNLGLGSTVSNKILYYKICISSKEYVAQSYLDMFCPYSDCVSYNEYVSSNLSCLRNLDAQVRMQIEQINKSPYSLSQNGLQQSSIPYPYSNSGPNPSSYPNINPSPYTNPTPNPNPSPFSNPTPSPSPFSNPSPIPNIPSADTINNKLNQAPIPLF